MVEKLQQAMELSIKALKNLASQGECVTICYNQAIVWQSRELAASFFLECMCESEGCERERYTSVLLDLMAGKEIAYDRATKSLTWEPFYR